MCWFRLVFLLHSRTLNEQKVKLVDRPLSYGVERKRLRIRVRVIHVEYIFSAQK